MQPAGDGPAPGLLVRLGAVAELGAKVLGAAPLFTRKSIGFTAGRHLYFSSAKAQEELGYRPRPLDGALQNAIGWFQSGESPHDVRGFRDRLRRR